MPVDPYSAIAEVGLPILGGIFGNAASQGDRDKALKDYQQNVKDLEAIGVPTVEAQQLMLEKYKSAGKLTPELEQAIHLSDSQMGGISLDPSTREAQTNALNSLKQIGDSGGMTLTDRANMEQTLGGIDAAERGRREAALSRVRARGQLGSGLELSANLGGAQDDITARHMAGITAAGQAQQRALAAISAGGALGGQMRSQEFDQKAKQAAAQDEIAKWNAANQQGINTRNTSTQNNSQVYNLANAQNLSNSNTDLSNKQQVYNKGLQQQYFDNSMNKAKSVANARTGEAQAYQNNADRTAAMWSGIGSGAGKIAGQALQPQQSTVSAEDDPNRLSKQIANYQF